MQVIAPLTSTADDCFTRARLQPPRKKTTSCGVFRHVLFPQMFSMGRVIAVPGVSHLLIQTTKIESKNQVFNYYRIELFVFISEITLSENDSHKKVKLFWGAIIHESGTKNYSKTVHVLAVRTQFVQWEHKLNAHSKLNESIQH